MSWRSLKVWGVVAAILVLCAGSAAGALTLVQDGESAYTIVIGDEAIPPEEYAAQELQHFIEEISGAELPIVKAAEAPGTPRIFVGPSSALDPVVRIDYDSLGQEGFVLATEKQDLVLAGGRPRGTLYAVYEFLKEYLGCRWYAPGVSKIPAQRTIEIPKIYREKVPAFERRRVRIHPISFQWDADLAARNFINTGMPPLGELHGGRWRFAGNMHNFYLNLVPPEKYFEDHPEYYSLQDGKRTATLPSQLCLTNPDVVEIATQSLLEILRKHTAERSHVDGIWVGQNDHAGYCQCDKCMAIAEKEGSQAGPLIHFVNQIAEAVAKEFPDIQIFTLAYQYTKPPPQHVKPRDNVAVMLCPSTASHSQPLATSDDANTATFRQQLDKWLQLTPNVWIFDYLTHYRYTTMPWPIYHTYGPNLKWFADKGIKGLILSGIWLSSSPKAEVRFGALQAYLLARLSWNPYLDWRAEQEEFMEAYYGPAAGPLLEYLNMWENYMNENNYHLYLWATPQDEYLNDEMLSRSEGLLDEAEAAVADDEVLRKRVRAQRLPVMYVRIVQGPVYDPIQYWMGDKIVFTPSRQWLEAIEELVSIAEECGQKQLSFYGSSKIDRWRSGLDTETKQFETIMLKSPSLAVRIIPALGGHIDMIYDRGLARNFLYAPNPVKPDDILQYRYGERCYEKNAAPGAGDAYSVIRQSGDSVTLSAELENGCTLTRTISLDAEKPTVTIASRLKNTSDEPYTASLRAYGSFAVGEAEKRWLVFTRSDNKDVSLQLAEWSKPHQWWLGRAMPKGSCTVWDEVSGTGVVNRFDPDQLHVVHTYAGEEHVVLELRAKPTELAPGEETGLTHSYQIIQDPGLVAQ